jgi:secondary thiamine-phosphate synthase enzyme
MTQGLHRLRIATNGQGLYEITDDVAGWLSGQAFRQGLLTLFVRHTSASLLIQENADPDVLRDLETFFATLAPEDPARYRHRAEGPDDMPGHIRSALTQTQISIPVEHGRMLLGTWQGIFLFEHRRAPHEREVVLHMTGS